MRAEPRPTVADVLPAARLDKLRTIRPRDYVIRFVMGAAISLGAGILGITIGARFSGVFLAFPAILPASLTLLEEKEGTRRADRDAIGAVLGGVGMMAFAMLGEAGYGPLPGVVAALLAIAGWVLVSFGLFALLAFLRPEDCDKSRD